ncbi:phosphorylase family protein [Gemmatimonas sp.]
MNTRARILVVAATARELATPGDWIGIVCGVGPVEAAVSTARAIAEHHPRAIVHVGIAGARARCALPPGALVVGTASHYSDLGDLPPEWATRELAPAPELLAAIRRAVPGVTGRPIGTTARVGGTADHDVEAMEGFAVLRAAQQARLPAIEVRAISNNIEESDRSRWHFASAFEAITAITPTLVRAAQDALDTSAQHA